MTDRPILFSAPMVRALLMDKKTQTRRILKSQPKLDGDDTWHVKFLGGGIIGVPTADVPIYAVHAARWEVGDQLWVRETWQTLQKWDDLAPRNIPDDCDKIRYEADDFKRNQLWAWGKLRQSIFMPRWASRLTLTITNIMVQRLQDISEEDCWREGIEEVDGGFDHLIPAMAKQMGESFEDGRVTYAAFWESINGRGSWDENPWVAKLTFTVEKRNIDG